MLDGAGFSPPYDFSLVRGLEVAGATVQLAMPDEVRRAWEAPDGLPPVKPSPLRKAARRVAKTVSYAAMLRELRDTIESWQPDVLHVQWLPLPIVDGRFLRAVEGRVPLVHTMHNTSLFHGTSGGVQGWGLHRSLALFDRVVVHSQYSHAAALRSGLVKESALRVIPHGAFDYYRDFAPGSPRSSAPVQLLFAGSIKWYKGLDVLIDALPTLADRTPRSAWHLTVAGQPGMPIEAVRQEVERRGLDSRVSWSLRHQSERELGQLLARSHVVVLPYREIDQSGVLLAAVGVERAVVATRVGAFPELLQHEQHGLLVPPEDPVALGQALARLVTDATLREHCEAQMKRLAGDTLHWTTIGRTTLDMYRELTTS